MRFEISHMQHTQNLHYHINIEKTSLWCSLRFSDAQYNRRSILKMPKINNQRVRNDVRSDHTNEWEKVNNLIIAIFRLSLHIFCYRNLTWTCSEYSPRTFYFTFFSYKSTSAVKNSKDIFLRNSKNLLIIFCWIKFCETVIESSSTSTIIQWLWDTWSLVKGQME